MRVCFIVFLIILAVFISGCSSEQDTDSPARATLIENECIKLCNSIKSKQDLSNGPCLSDTAFSWNIEDWVCDVAHNPRQPEIDDKPENQCLTFREGKATHFVEVDTNCTLIRSV